MVKNRLRQKHGFTLSEMLFCLLLMSFISLMASNALITSFSAEKKSEKDAVITEASNTILSRITDVISSLDAGEVRVSGDGKMLYTDGSISDNAVTIQKKDSKLSIDYSGRDNTTAYRISRQNNSDSSIYRDIAVTGLTFTQSGDSITINLTVRDNSGQTYTFSAGAMCIRLVSTRQDIPEKPRE